MLTGRKVSSGHYRHSLIVVEGIDGAGKTTVARRLAVALRAKYLSTPPPPLDSIRKYFDKQTSVETRFLFYLCSVAFASDIIRRELVKRDVVCDRYLGSTLAYHRALGMRVRWDARELSVVRPDFAFFLHVSDERERMRRIKGRGKITRGDRLVENSDLRERLIREYNKFRWYKIDTSNRSVEEVVAVIRSRLSL
jgi:dTMP kinase